MYLNTIKTPKGKIIAVCDKELIDKCLKQGKIILDIKSHASFYKGKIVKEEEVINAIQSGDSLNLVGEKCIALADKLGIINKQNAKKIQGIPHIQVYKI